MRGVRPGAIDLTSPSYTPSLLLNKTAELLGAINDSQLSRLIECDLAAISRVRNRKDQVSAVMMVQIMDRTGWHIQTVRKLAGIPFDEDGWTVVVEELMSERQRPVLPDGLAAKLRDELQNTNRQIRELLGVIPRVRIEKDPTRKHKRKIHE